MIKGLLITFLAVLLMGIASFAIFIIYQNFPGEPEEFSVFSKSENLKQNVSYGKTPVFMPNMRFNHTMISYSIEPSCPVERREKMQEAFIIIEQRTKLSFYERQADSDISVRCSKNAIETEKNLFLAGEGGPSEFIQTELYNVILKGQILLYQESLCDYPIVELHELLHVLSFDHSKDPSNIMHNFSNCEQKITDEIIETINSLYSIEPLSELYIGNITAVKKGSYLDFQITLKNKGLIPAQAVSLSVYSGDKEIKSFSFETISVEAGQILKVENLKLPSRSTSEIKFIIDSENKLIEYDKTNNVLEMSVG